MRFLKMMMAGLSLTGLALLGSTSAQAADNKGYALLANPQPTNSGKKVEVIEFFSYACPHCAGFDPVLENWVKKQGANIDFKRVPVLFHKDWVFYQKMYYTMQEMGKLNELHAKIFTTIHNERQPLNSDEKALAFAVKNGLDAQKFSSTWNGFGVNTSVKRANQMQETYKAFEAPYIVIDGKYVTAPERTRTAQTQTETQLQFVALQVMDDLVGKAKKK
jgi:thiol:disulfide interchange protein DsbA